MGYTHIPHIGRAMPMATPEKCPRWDKELIDLRTAMDMVDAHVPNADLVDSGEYSRVLYLYEFLRITGRVEAELSKLRGKIADQTRLQ